MQQGSMKPIFGMILIGGAIVLWVGLFTGKIQFPLQASTPNNTPTNTGATTGTGKTTTTNTNQGITVYTPTGIRRIS